MSGDIPPALRPTAFHEAGHAVVGHHFGHPTVSVTIVAHAESLGSHLAPSMYGLDLREFGKRQRRAVAREMIICCYAGLAAQGLVDPDCDPSQASTDDALAFELSREWGVGPRSGFIGDDAHRAYLDRLRREARVLVQRLYGAIAAVAEELLARGTIDGEHIASVISRVGRG